MIHLLPDNIRSRTVFPAMLWAGLLTLVLQSGNALANGWMDDWDLSADAEIGWRWFPGEPRWQGQTDHPGVSLALSAEAYWRGDDARASFKPFLRLDSVDTERSHFDLREAYLAWEGDSWELLAGTNKVFWGVTESRHLVDIINQTDLVEDPDQEQKLGQPMLMLSLERDWGLLQTFLLPWFRERSFPGRAGRLRAPLPVATNRASYESGAGEFHTDLALRWSHYFGDLDVGAYLFHGTGREPKLLVSEDLQSLQPYYHQITQLGLDVQYTRDAWLWKLEAIARDGLDDRFLAVVAGLEYTFFGIRGSALDLGLLFEVLHDGRGPTEPATAFDDDLFFGTRLAWNDQNDTSLLAGLMADRNDPEWFFNLEAERRLGDSLVAKARLRLFHGDGDEGDLSAIDRDDYLELRLSKYY